MDTLQVILETVQSNHDWIVITSGIITGIVIGIVIILWSKN